MLKSDSFHLVAFSPNHYRFFVFFPSIVFNLYQVGPDNNASALDLSHLLYHYYTGYNRYSISFVNHKSYLGL